MAVDKQELNQKVKDQMQELAARFDKIKTSFEESASGTKESIQTKVEELKADAHVQEEKAKHLQQEIDDWFAAKKSHTKQQIDEWKHKRQVDKLDYRAAKAQKHAAHTLERAAIHLLAAEQAVLEAFDATLEAEEARDG